MSNNTYKTKNEPIKGYLPNSNERLKIQDDGQLFYIVFNLDENMIATREIVFFQHRYM